MSYNFCLTWMNALYSVILFFKVIESQKCMIFFKNYEEYYLVVCRIRFLYFSSKRKKQLYLPQRQIFLNHLNL